jgi:hypothetical protein
MRARMQNWRPQRSLSTRQFRPLRRPHGTAYRRSNVPAALEAPNEENIRLRAASCRIRGFDSS